MTGARVLMPVRRQHSEARAARPAGTLTAWTCPAKWSSSSSLRTTAGITSTRPISPAPTQGDSLDEATENAGEAPALYVDGLRDDGRSLSAGVVRRKLPLSA